MTFDIESFICFYFSIFSFLLYIYFHSLIPLELYLMILFLYFFLLLYSFICRLSKLAAFVHTRSPDDGRPSTEERNQPNVLCCSQNSRRCGSDRDSTHASVYVYYIAVYVHMVIYVFIHVHAVMPWGPHERC